MHRVVRNKMLTMLFATVAVVGSAAQEQDAAGQNQGGPKCKSVHADMVENRSTTACRPGHSACFLGEVDGNHGLRGTTYFRGDSGGGSPPTSPEFSSYSGVFEYSTSRGLIVARETGVTSSTFGVVTAYQRITQATGEFAGVTGHFFVNGFLGGGRVVTNVTGEICYP